MARAAASLLAIALLPVLYGCGGGPRPVARPARAPEAAAQDRPAQSLDQIVAINNRLTATTVEAGGQLSVWQGDRRVAAWPVSVIAARSGAVRVRADGFDLASDGATVRVRAGAAAETTLGAATLPVDRADSPWLLVSPLLLADALLPRHLPEPPHGDDNLVVAEHRAQEDVVTWLRRSVGASWGITRRVGASGGQLRWTEQFAANGRQRSRVDYRYADGDAANPQEITIHGAGVRLLLEVESFDTRPSVDSATFRLE